ncbi:MAG: acyltransferase [Actinobacteria bacterium]|nr:acyltransferase [Actinomycetota bacterium]
MLTLDLIAETAVLHLPAGRIGWRLKLLALRAAGADVQWPLRIDPNVWIRQPHNFSAGPDTVISRGAVLNCSTSLRLGPGCLIGYYAFLGTASHRVPARDRQITASGHDHEPIELGRDCWVGAHACVLPGVHLGDGAVVGSGAVVTKNVSDGNIVIGTAARVLGSRPPTTGGPIQ